MKRNGLLFAVFMLTAAVVFSGCGSSGGGGGGDNSNNLGKIMVALTEATEFNGKPVICAVFDSDDTDETGPTGELLGMGYIDEVTDGSGSCVILDDDENDKIFEPGVYYLRALADLNDNFDELGGPDAGDKVMPFTAITVNGDVTKNITGAAFTITLEDESLETISALFFGDQAPDNIIGKSLICFVYDSDATTPDGWPTGNYLGEGIMQVLSYAECVIMDNGVPKKFSPGDYYLLAIVDLNDNYEELQSPDAGDVVMKFVPVNVDGDPVNGDTFKSFQWVDFSMIIPPAQNHITNGGFEEVRDWTISWAGDYDHEPGNAHIGRRSMYIEPGGHCVYQEYEGSMDDLIGNILAACLYAKGSIGESMQINICSWDSLENVLVDDTSEHIFTGDDYQECWNNTDTPVSGDTSKIRLSIITGEDNEGRVWIDDVYLGKQVD